MSESARDRLLVAAELLFAEHGFDAVSVRQVCEAANTSSNMVHHYFGSKQGLFDAIIGRFTQAVFAVPMRMIEEAPRSCADLETRLDLFARETLRALIDQRHVLHILNRHQIEAEPLSDLMGQFVAFLTRGQEQGCIRAELDIAMISGVLMDRLGVQVLHADRIRAQSGFDILTDDAYQDRWLRANLDLLLKGLFSDAVRSA